MSKCNLMPEQPSVPLLAKSCAIGPDGIMRVEYWDGHKDTFSQTYEAVVQVVDAEECIWQLYKFAYWQSERAQNLKMAAKDALSLLRCEKEFPEDLCIKVGNVVRYERVVRELEQALAELEGD